MIVDHCTQMSDEWFKARSGIPTASHFSDIITSKCAKSDSSSVYKYSLLAERLGSAREEFSGKWMKRGIELEPEARNSYQFSTGIELDEVGLIFKDERKTVSCSPDGIRAKSGLEIKCPAPATHVKYLLRGKLPNAYYQQVQGSMYVTGFKTWDFMSYCPGVKSLIITVERDEKFMTAFDGLLALFNYELDEDYQKLTA